MSDTLWVNARLLTMTAGMRPVEAGVIAAQGGRIVYAGPADGAPDAVGAQVVDCGGRWITPALVDCHTHLVYAGSRAAE